MTQVRLPNWLITVGFGLIIFSTSLAGYYSGQAYTDFATRGYYTDTGSVTNALTPIGTAATVLACLFALFAVRRARSGPLVWFLLVQTFIIITSTWSAVPGQSTLIVFKTVIYAYAIYLVVQRLSYPSIIRITCVISLALCISGNYLALTDGNFATSIGAAGWRGLFSHKNQYAAFCLFSFIIIYPAAYDRRVRYLCALTAAVLFSTTIATQGKTSLSLMIGYATVTTVAILLRRASIPSTSIVKGLSLVSATAITLGLPTFFALLYSGSISLSGRVDIWSKYIDFTSLRALYGYGGYTASISPEALGQQLGLPGSIAIDSTYLSVLINWGIIGILVLASLLITFWLSAIRKARSEYAITAVCTVVVFILYAVVESNAQLNWLYPNMTLLMKMLMLFKDSEDATINESMEVIDRT